MSEANPTWLEKNRYTGLKSRIRYKVVDFGPIIYLLE
jgi:hypothetical protein